MGVGVILVLIGRRDIGLVRVTEIFEVDSVGLSLITLRLWIGLISILGRTRVNKFFNYNKGFLFLNLLLIVFLVLRFSFREYLIFYMRFEARLVPILLIILGWGLQPERTQAGIYILMYTLFGSLPLLFGLLFWQRREARGSMFFYISSVVEGGAFFFLLIAFLVKFPIYGTHLWLLKAHVEAPVGGSILLAGVLLKLGGYGIIRVFPIFTGNAHFIEWLVCLSLWGGLVIRVRCLRQLDIKLLVARSSVAHMRGCIGGILVLRELGLKGRVGIIVAHGLCSSGLFFLVNVVYSRTGRRRLIIRKGLLNLMPIIRIWWFFMIVVNIRGPPRINLLSEVILIIRLVRWRRGLIFCLRLITFFRAGYRLYLFSLSQHGSFFFRKGLFQGASVVEYIVIRYHWGPLNLLILSFYLVL